MTFLSKRIIVLGLPYSGIGRMTALYRYNSYNVLSMHIDKMADCINSGNYDFDSILNGWEVLWGLPILLHWKEFADSNYTFVLLKRNYAQWKSNARTLLDDRIRRSTTSIKQQTVSNKNAFQRNTDLIQQVFTTFLDDEWTQEAYDEYYDSLIAYIHILDCEYKVVDPWKGSDMETLSRLYNLKGFVKPDYDEPSLLQMAKNYRKELKEWKRKGKIIRSPERMEEIYSICTDCDEFEKESSSCNVCGCYLDPKRKRFNKIAWATTECPLKKWTAEKGLKVNTRGCKKTKKHTK